MCPTPLPSQIAIAPRWPHAANWNDYVDATDTSQKCDADLSSNCLHGGEHRIVSLQDWNSCDDISASDSVNAFVWTCDASSGTAVFMSSGLRAGKGMHHLLDATITDWRVLSVSVAHRTCGTTVDSTPAAWWRNPVAQVPENATSAPLSLDGDVDSPGDLPFQNGTVFMVPNHHESSGYKLNLPHSSFVVLENAELQHIGTQSSCDMLSNNPFPPGTPCLLTAEGVDYLWVEGTYRGHSGTGSGILLTDSNFSRVHNIVAAQVNGAAILLDASRKLRVNNVLASTSAVGLVTSMVKDSVFNNIAASDNEMSGVWVNYGSNGNHFSDIRVARNQRAARAWHAGLLVQASDNYFDNIVASETAFDGVLVMSFNNILSRVVATHNLGTGIYIKSPSNILLAATTVGNGHVGLRIGLSGGDDNTVAQIASINNNTGIEIRGVLSQPATENQLANLHATHNVVNGLALHSTENNSFSGFLWVGNNGSAQNDDCFLEDSMTPGIDNTVSECAGSSGLLNTLLGVSADTSFHGQVVTDERNAHALQLLSSPGTVSASDISDWTTFENRWRTWGPSASSQVTNAANVGACGSRDCAIWDWRLSKQDSSWNGNPALLGVVPCPAQAEIVVHRFNGGATVTFLKRAVELTGDGLGNDNLLCESNESCLYTPNLGAYQGHGPLQAASAVGGCADIGPGAPVENIVLLQHTENGS